MRGQGAFQHAEVAGLVHGADLSKGDWCPLDGEAFANYVAFYRTGISAHKSTYGVLEVAEDRIFVQLHEPENPRSWAIVCHGYYDHAGLYAHCVDALLERNIGVAIFDQIGHGLSSGEPAAIDSFQSYIAVIQRMHRLVKQVAEGRAIHWLGQSMGGALIMEYWRQQQDRPSGELMLFAPLVRPYAWSWIRGYFAVVKHFVQRRPRRMRADIDDPDFVNLLYKDPLQSKVLPVTWVQAMVDWFTVFERGEVSDLAPRVIYGYQDKTVDYRHGFRVFDRLYPGAYFRAFPPAHHHLVNEKKEIRDEFWAWLDQVCEW